MMFGALRRRLVSVGLGWPLIACVLAPPMALLSAATLIADSSGTDPLTGDTSPLRVTAQVDKTTVELGSQFTLTITLEGDVTNLDLQPFEFPKALRVVAQSRSSNLSMGSGEVKRSVSLTYLLIPQETGTFRLGPFQVLQKGKPVLTDPLDIVVKKPILPPGSPTPQRFTL